MTSKRKNPCTNWFPGHVKPVRVGVYRRLFGDGAAYSYWDGTYWRINGSNPRVAHEWDISGYQNLAWCGLANSPNGSEK